MNECAVTKKNGEREREGREGWRSTSLEKTARLGMLMKPPRKREKRRRCAALVVVVAVKIKLGLAWFGLVQIWGKPYRKSEICKCKVRVLHIFPAPPVALPATSMQHLHLRLHLHPTQLHSLTLDPPKTSNSWKMGFPSKFR